VSIYDVTAQNPYLFKQLKSYFGRVRVWNRGQGFEYEEGWDGSRPICAKTRGGEEYAVCCPRCGDKRFRLHINHMWNEPDPVTGYPMRHLIRCWNEECDWSDLSDELLMHTPDQGAHESPMAMPSRMSKGKSYLSPGKLAKLTELEDDHEVVVYLRDQRGFDLEELERVWGVKFCYRTSHPRTEGLTWFTQDRIVLPVKDVDGKVVGWQSRHLDDQPKKKVLANGEKIGIPKYYTMPGMSKGAHLYGLYKCHQSKQLVIVEGATDVWCVGPPAVCPFGCTLSLFQERLLCATEAEDLYLVFDRESDEEKAKKIDKEVTRIRKVLGERFRIHEVTLPEAGDPADYDRDYVRQIIDSF